MIDVCGEEHMHTRAG